MRIRLLYIIGLIVLLTLVGCGSDDSQVVAEGKSLEITLDEFRIAYLDLLKQPMVFDSPQLRENCLNDLVNRRLLADEIRAMGGAEDERIQARITAFREKCLRDEHYRQIIESQISYSEKDLRRTYRYLGENRHIRHLFTADSITAVDLYRRATGGDSFASLAREVFKDESLANNGGDLGWVRWEQLDYNLAEAAYGLGVNGISSPVRSAYGWHIIQVLNIEYNPLVDETEYQRQQHFAEDRLKLKLGEKIAAEYITKTMTDRRITVNPKVLEAVVGQVAGRLNRIPNAIDAVQLHQLKEVELVRLEQSLEELRNQNLLAVDGKDYTVAQVLYALQYVPYYATCRNFKEALDFVIRDFVLSEEARRMGIGDNVTIDRRVAVYSDRLLEPEARRRLIAPVKVSPEEVRAVYDEKIAQGWGATFEQSREIIEKELLNIKKQQAVNNRTQELRQRQGIMLNPVPIHDYYDSVLADT